VLGVAPPAVNYYTQVVSALPPATGVSGDIKLATLTFYIYEDICWPEQSEYDTFEVDGKLSDSCSNMILKCDSYNADVEFDAAEPDIMMKPNNETNFMWGIHEKFTKEIWVSDITKMKSLYFELRWDKWNAAWKGGSPKWNSMVKLVTAEFDPVSLPAGIIESATVSPVEDLVSQERIFVDIKIKCTAKPLRGTFRVLTLVFQKLDPWECGYQPEYKFTQPHTWTTQNATCTFWFEKGWFDVYCPGLEYIYFGKAFNKPLGTAFKLTLGKTEWLDCAYAHKGGGAIKLTTYQAADTAGVKFTIGNIGNPYDALTKYITIADIVSDPQVWIGAGGTGGVFTAVICNDTTTTPHTPRVWIVDTPSGAGPGYHPGAPTTYSLYGWNGKDWNSLSFVGFAGTSWANIPTISTYRVLGFAAFMGFPKATTGNNVVDDWQITIKDVRGNYLLSPNTVWAGADIEPLQTSKWYDKTLYKLLYCNPKIVNLYTFVPIPGDLNRDGVVDIVDVMIIASMYGLYEPYYNFDSSLSNVIDIFDIVIVCKNFGRTTP
jgi:hypothetical protein